MQLLAAKYTPIIGAFFHLSNISTWRFILRTGSKLCGLFLFCHQPRRSFIKLLFLLESFKYLSLCLSSLTPKNDLSRLSPHCSLWIPGCLPLLSGPDVPYLRSQAPFLLRGDNKQLFAVRNNKDYHHGYLSIPWAQWPLLSPKRSNYVTTSKTGDNMKKENEGIGPSYLSDGWIEARFASGNTWMWRCSYRNAVILL